MDISIGNLGVNIRHSTVENLRDFITINSADGVYSKETALRNLLACLVPDSRVFVLRCLSPGVIYERDRHCRNLQKGIATDDVVWRAKVLDANEKLAAKLEHAVSGVLPDMDYIRSSIDSWRVLFVRSGIIEAMEITEDGKTTVRYSLTKAGELLLKPLAECVIHFVATARKNLPEHNFDSMEKLLGHPRRVMKVYEVVKWLVENGQSTEAALTKMFWGKQEYQPDSKFASGNFSKVLHEMRHAGLIDLAAAAQKTYRISNGGIRFFGLDQCSLYKSSRKAVPDQWFPQDIFELIIGYMSENPDEKYTSDLVIKDASAVLERRGADAPKNLKSYVRLSLRALVALGMLERADGIKRLQPAAIRTEGASVSETEDMANPKQKWNRAQSVVSANAMSILFYEIVLKNAERAASLVPEAMDRYQISVEDEKAFIRNMEEEDSRKGKKRDRLEINRVERFIRTKTRLSSRHSTSVQEIQDSLASYGLSLSRDAVRGVLDTLRCEKRVEHVGRGYYAVPKRLLKLRM